jgi:hypothetical protein
MSLLARLESKFGRYAVPNLTVFLIAGQVLAFIADSAPRGPGGASLLDNIRLMPDKVLQGEWWRIITYLFDAPFTPIPIFMFFFWYLFYLMGTTLEANWGAFRYNVYLFVGYVASVVMTFIAWSVGGLPGEVASNGFLYGSVFLAFARLYPDFTLYLFFVLPVKIKWLALITWIGYAWTFITSPSWLDRGVVIAAVLNYLLFFGRDIWSGMKHGHRRMKFQARAVQGRGGKRRLTHECRVCGLTSETSPRTQFRYCSQCGGDNCYCPEHLDNHEHVVAERGQESGVGG